MSTDQTAPKGCPDGLAWFKSSYSGPQGGDCLEVAYDWHKSSYSGSQGGQCLEVARTAVGEVRVRDSKHPDGPQFAFRASAWDAFVTAATDDRFGPVQ